MGLFGRKKHDATEQIDALREELVALRERLDSTDAAKSRLEENVGQLHAENGRLRDELLVQITSATSASNEATRTLAEQTASHFDEQRARLADLAVVATDAAERAAAGGQLDEETAARIAAVETQAAAAEIQAAAAEAQARSADERASSAAEQAATADERATSADERAAAVGERVDVVDGRLTQVATELANQLTELSGEIDAAATTGGGQPPGIVDQSVGLDPELVEELIDAQERLANEQARYQIAFRQDLADLADRLKRQR